MINLADLYPYSFSDLGKAPTTTNNSLALGKPGKGIKTHFFKESDFEPELAPKNAKVKRIKINDVNLVVMSY